MLARLLLLAALAACATTPTHPALLETGPVVRDLRLRGNDEVGSGTIRGAIATRETNRFLFFGAVHRLDPGAVAQDVRRIRDLHEEAGFYAAQVEARVVEVGPDEVDVEFTIQEGPPTIVRTFLVAGLDGLPEEQVAEILADPPFGVGERFVEEDWVEWKASVLERLRERGFARAEVNARVEVAPAEGVAEAILLVARGERWQFGEIRVVGNLLVEEEQIRSTAGKALKPGTRYAPSRMREAQEDVFALGVFSVATVSDRSADDGPPVADVVVAVNEADFLRLRLGAGVGLDQSYYQTRALAEVTHLNAFGGLQQLQWRNVLAWRFLNPASQLAGESGPAGTSALSFTQPQVIGNRLDLLARVQYERELRHGYSAQSLGGRIGTPIRIRRDFHLVPSYNVTRFFDVEVFDEGQVDPVVPGVRPSLVGDCPRGCTLSWLEQQVVVDRRDDPLEPREGWFAALGLQQGGLGGDFAWLRFSPQARGYIPLGTEVVLAGRLEAGYLLPLSECDPTQEQDPYLAAVGCSPIVVRFFGGGADGFRGVGADRLSPLRVTESDGRTRYIPLGGNASFLASGELRWYFSESWSTVLFLDGANVAETAADTFDLGTLQWAVGSGLRLRTPIGPVRLDVGYRFLRDPTVPVGGGPPPEESTLDYFAIFLSIGEAF